MHKAIVTLLSLLLAGCATDRFAPLDGMPVAIGETVRVGALTATARRLVEDSRCPLTVQCVHAGRVVVSTQITGPAGTETVPLVLGEPYPVQGGTVTLVSARPAKWDERRRPRGEYRFVFEGG